MNVMRVMKMKDLRLLIEKVRVPCDHFWKAHTRPADLPQ
jgi:hypothetical protein